MEMDSTALTQYFSNNTYFDVIIYLKTRESTHTSDPTSEIKDAHSTETSNIIYKIIRFTSATELSTGYLSSVDLHNSTFDSLTTDTTDITNVAFTSSSTIDLQFKCINDDDNIIIGYFKNDGDTELTKVGLNSETFMIIFGEPNQIEAGPNRNGNIPDETNFNNTIFYTPNSGTTALSIICFYGFVNVMTEQGLKQIKDLKRGDMILTNDGYQPLAELDVGFNPSEDLLMTKLKTTDFMVKIPKDFFIENVPSEDVYVTKTHPLSVKITSADDDKDFEFLHLFVEELMQLGDGIEYVRKNSETKLYNLIFDNHYEISVGNMKFLSHHPNHLNKNKYLVEGTEKNQQNRTKKIYAIEGQCF